MYMKPSLQLRKAQGLISDSRRWCTDSLAEDQNGRKVGVDDDRAERFCAKGALIRSGCTSHAGDYLIKAAQKLSSNELPPLICSVSAFNDTSTHAQVMFLFETAIKLAEEEGN